MDPQQRSGLWGTPAPASSEPPTRTVRPSRPTTGPRWRAPWWGSRDEPIASQQAQLEADAFARLLPAVEGSRVLVLGCGDGRGARILLERGADEVVAVEAGLAPLARRDAFHHPTLRRLACDPMRLPFSTATFDVVVARRCLSRLPDLDAVLEELAAVLRPGGHLVVTDPHPFVLLGSPRASRPQGSPSAHLPSDFLDGFGRWGLGLEALEEPRWAGSPRVMALRARRLAEGSRTPREGRRSPPVGAVGRPLVAARAPASNLGRFKTRVEELAADACSALWRFGFRRFASRRPGLDRLRPGGGRRIWLVTAQPGDEMTGCAATLLAHRLAGDEVRVLHVTDGRHGDRALGLRRSELATLRRHEADEVALHLDLEQSWFALDPWRDFDRIARHLERRLGEERPEIVYAPSRITARDDAEIVSRALAAALGALEPPDSDEPEDPAPEIRVYPVDVPLGPALWTAALPATRAELTALLAASYVSRRDADRAALRRRQYDALMLGLPGLLETFLQLDPEDYRRWHRAAGRGRRPWWPLARNPWTDPLAYLRGDTERRRLQRLRRL